ncbi:MAG: hypothetical protein RPS47_15655 [Colwellia sp.]|jgi:hypothetical protein
MADITEYAFWPSNLGFPLLKGYSYTPSNNLLQSALDSGEMRVRRRFKNMPGTVTINLLFNNEQAALFEGWFRNVINEGTVWFSMPIKMPAGVIVHLARFKLPHKPMKAIAHTKWTKSITLEVKERVVIDGENTAFLEEYKLSDVEVAALIALEAL